TRAGTAAPPSGPMLASALITWGWTSFRDESKSAAVRSGTAARAWGPWSARDLAAALRTLGLSLSKSRARAGIPVLRDWNARNPATAAAEPTSSVARMKFRRVRSVFIPHSAVRTRNGPRAVPPGSEPVRVNSLTVALVSEAGEDGLADR